MEEDSPTPTVSCSGTKVEGKLFSKKTRAIIWGLQTRAVQVISLLSLLTALAT